jgi:hypothetical protein
MIAAFPRLSSYPVSCGSAVTAAGAVVVGSDGAVNVFVIVIVACVPSP